MRLQHTAQFSGTGMPVAQGAQVREKPLYLGPPDACHAIDTLHRAAGLGNVIDQCGQRGILASRGCMDDAVAIEAHARQ